MTKEVLVNELRRRIYMDETLNLHRSKRLCDTEMVNKIIKDIKTIAQEDRKDDSKED